jgi:hypothetical protein
MRACHGEWRERTQDEEVSMPSTIEKDDSRKHRLLAGLAAAGLLLITSVPTLAAEDRTADTRMNSTIQFGSKPSVAPGRNISA